MSIQNAIMDKTQHYDADIQENGGGVRHDGETKRQQKSAYLEALRQSDERLRGEQSAGGGQIRG